MNMDAFENAIAACVVRESGIAAGKVIWTNQTRARPARPFIELSVLDDPNNNQHSYQEITENPDVDPDSFASADLHEVYPATYETPSVLQALVPGVAGNGLQFSITAVPETDPVPFFDVEFGTVIIHCGANGEVNPQTLTVFIQTNSNALGFTGVLNGTTPITQSLSLGLDGGFPGQNPLLISNVDHPDLEVQLVAFSTDVTGDNRAFNILERVRVKLGSVRANDALGDVAVVDRGTVRDISDVLDNEYEGRAASTITFRVADVNVEEAQEISTVEIEVKIERTNDTVTDDITLT